MGQQHEKQEAKEIPLRLALIVTLLVQHSRLRALAQSDARANRASQLDSIRLSISDRISARARLANLHAGSPVRRMLLDMTPDSDRCSFSRWKQTRRERQATQPSVISVYSAAQTVISTCIGTGCVERAPQTALIRRRWNFLEVLAVVPVWMCWRKKNL